LLGGDTLSAVLEMREGGVAEPPSRFHLQQVGWNRALSRFRGKTVAERQRDVHWER